MSNTRTPAASAQHRRFVLPVAALVLGAILAGCGDKPQIDPEKSATLIQPVARVEMRKAVEEASGDRDGESVYKAVCSACHAVGVAGAPKTGNADDWKPRIAKGLDANIASVINGLGAMPARGGNPNVSDVEVRRAVVHLMNAGGANFSE